jgi:hypothetical protein
MVTGSVTGAVTWLPPAVESVPLVVEPEPGAVEPDAPVPVVDVDADAPLEDASPSTDTALPPTVTGAATGAVTWLPPAVESVPLVVEPEPDPVEPDVPDPLVDVEADEPLEFASPSTDTALPPAVTGAATGAVTWLPPAVESVPLVVDPDVPEPVVDVDADEPLEVASPSTEMLLPDTATGADTGAATWLPPAVESVPFVVEPAVPPPPAVLDPVELLDVESPSTEMVLPEAVTGALTTVASWLPARVPDVPFVSSAEAVPAKNRIPPPTSRAASRPLRTYACMVVPS